VLLCSVFEHPNFPSVELIPDWASLILTSLSRPFSCSESCYYKHNPWIYEIEFRACFEKIFQGKIGLKISKPGLVSSSVDWKILQICWPIVSSTSNGSLSINQCSQSFLKVPKRFLFWHFVQNSDDRFKGSSTGNSLTTGFATSNFSFLGIRYLFSAWKKTWYPWKLFKLTTFSSHLLFNTDILV